MGISCSWIAECVGRAVAQRASEKGVPILCLRHDSRSWKATSGGTTAERRAIEREADGVELHQEAWKASP